MKQTVSLVRALSFLPVLMLLVVTSCTPDKIEPNPVDVCPNLPGVQTNAAECQPIPGAPYLNVFLSRDTAWYADTVKCTFSSDGVVFLNGSSEISNPVVSTNITAPVSYQLTATKTVNGVTSPTTKRDVNIPVRTPFITDFCWNFMSNDHGKWKNTAVSVNGVPKPELVDNSGDVWVHRPNGIRNKVTPSGNSTPSFYEIRVSGPDTFVTLGLPATPGGPPNEWKIESLNSSTWVISKVSGGSTLVATYQKVL